MDLRKLVQRQLEGKALGPSPAFEDPGTPVQFVDLNRGREGKSPLTGTTGSIGRRQDHQSGRYLGAYGGEQAMDLVMDCVRYLGDTVANAEYHFEAPSKTPGPRIPGKHVSPPEGLAKLLESPNPYMDYIEMMELLVMDLLLTGNAYWFKWKTNEEGQPIAIYRLAPPYVEIETKPWGPAAYIYQIPNADKLTIEPAEIVHFRMANPRPDNPYYGMGLLQGAGRTADLELSVTDTQAAYFENHAMPSITVESDRRIPRDVFKKMAGQLRNRAGGSRNAGQLLILEAGLKMNSIAPNAAEAGLEGLSRLSRDRIFALFRINPKLIGFSDEASPETLREAQQHFDNKTAKPFLNKLQTKITKELTEAWKLVFAYDYEYQLAPEEVAKVGGEFGRTPGIIIDEVRAVMGLGPHPDKTIGEITLNLPGAEGGEGGPEGVPTENGFPDKNLPGEPGRPPKPKNTKAFPKNGAPLPAGARARRSKPTGKSIDQVLEVLSEIEAKALTTAHKTPRLLGEHRPEDTLVDVREADVDSIVAVFTADLANAARVLERGLLDTAEGKSMSDVVSRMRASKAWGHFKVMATKAYEESLLRVMSAAAMHHNTIGVTPTDEIDYEALIDELVARRESGVNAISKSFKNDLAEKIKAARTEDASLASVQQAIQAAVAEWSEKHAPTVALTEATRGYNESTLAVVESAGGTHVLVSDGKDDDEPCIEADGQVWTLDQARENILEHPNCRRAFVPIAA